MARKIESPRAINVAVVGLSGMEKDKGNCGVGKSCLCNRFIRAHSDEYYMDHITVLSQTDFSGRVVNNDHFLYWGEKINATDDGTEYHFTVIEQTEFINDDSFYPFKSGKMEPYVKRCAATRVFSAEKLMYICKNQLGIEKEYEQKSLPDGKLSIDGFICVFDVSIVPGRSADKQIDVVNTILHNLFKTKKPIVLVTTKNDERNEVLVREVDKLVQRKEFKTTIPIIETSAHKNVNVDIAFIMLAQLVDRSKFRCKSMPYSEAAYIQKELENTITEEFLRLIKLHVSDFRTLWSQVLKKLNTHQAWIDFVHMFGIESTQEIFRRFINTLREEHIAKRMAVHLSSLSKIFCLLISDFNMFTEGDWESVRQYIKLHPDFELYFYECPLDTAWIEYETSTSGKDSRIPDQLLDLIEAENVFKQYINTLKINEKKVQWEMEFKQLLDNSSYISPGKKFSEVCVLFMGRECFEALSHHEAQQIYDIHQLEIIEKAKEDFQELLLENSRLFFRVKYITQLSAFGDDDINEVTEILRNDIRYKRMDRLEDVRKLMLIQHINFIQAPGIEHCSAFPNCMDTEIEKILGSRLPRLPTRSSSFNQWLYDWTNNDLNIMILGTQLLVEPLIAKMKTLVENTCDCDIDHDTIRLNQHITNHDGCGVPLSSLDKLPHGCIFTYSTMKDIDFLRSCIDMVQESFKDYCKYQLTQSLPIVAILYRKVDKNSDDLLQLAEDGKTVARSIGGTFYETTADEVKDDQLVSSILHNIITSIRETTGIQGIYEVVMNTSEPDLRIGFGLFCGDSYFAENLITPLFSYNYCVLSGSRNIVFEAHLGDSKRRIEIYISSYHTLSCFEDLLFHGFILVYSTERRASLSNLSTLVKAVSCVPIQIIAVTNSISGAKAFFNNEVSHHLISEGNALADTINAHFTTTSSMAQHKGAFYTPFLKKVWENKLIMKGNYRSTTNGQINNATKSICDLYESKHDISFSKFKPFKATSRHSITPPEPAPPDHSNSCLLGRSRIVSTSQTSLDDVNSDSNGSQESITRIPDEENRFHINGSSFWKTYEHSFTTERRQCSNKDWKYKGGSQTLKQSNKLGTQSIRGCSIVKEGIAKVVDAMSTVHQYKTGAYTLNHDICGRSNFRKRREKGQSSYSDTDSEWSSLERRQRAAQIYTKVNKKCYNQKRQKKKRSAIPVQPPRVPKMMQELPHKYDYYDNSSINSVSENGPTQSISPEDSDDAHSTLSYLNLSEVKSSLEPQPILDSQLTEISISTLREKKNQHSSLLNENHWLNESRTKNIYTDVKFLTSSDAQLLSSNADGPRVLKNEKSNSLTAPVTSKCIDIVKGDQRCVKGQKTIKRAEEIRKDMKKRNDKNKKKKENCQFSTTLSDYVQSEVNCVPIFLEKCVEYIEREGLDFEGIYRVPGNRSHVDLLFMKFQEDSRVDIKQLDIPVNAVATALKDFVSKRLPHLFEDNTISQLEDIAGGKYRPMVSTTGNLEITADRSTRLLALQSILKNLPSLNFHILKYIFQHFVRVSEHSHLNSMDSKNLAICWWPTLLPIEFNDLGKFELMRPYLEEIVQTMINQFPFLFCGEEAIVMV